MSPFLIGSVAWPQVSDCYQRQTMLACNRPLPSLLGLMTGLNEQRSRGCWVGRVFPLSAAAMFMVSNVEPPSKGPGSLPGFLSAQGLQPEGSPGAAVMPGHDIVGPTRIGVAGIECSLMRARVIWSSQMGCLLLTGPEARGVRILSFNVLCFWIGHMVHSRKAHCQPPCRPDRAQ